VPRKKTSNSKKLPKELPAEFVERTISLSWNYESPISDENSFFSSIQFGGATSCPIIMDDNLWNAEHQMDLGRVCYNIVKEFVTYMQTKSYRPLRNTVICSLDIETTDFMPKAFEGFVNHICQARLDTRSDERLCLQVFQIINMNRKKEHVQFMLPKVWEFMHSPEIQLVFNEHFDIPIIKSCITNAGLDLAFPEKIIDLMKYGKSLDKLETWIESKTGFHRQKTEKGHYSEYYKQFKKTKQLDPISSYNMMDTLTPLLGYLVLHRPPLKQKSLDPKILDKFEHPSHSIKSVSIGKVAPIRKKTTKKSII
jgi:uncharacterized protein YprB with RNaseH-like and TPR domain